jgi:quercetin dioxygenase-like cupin family protein
LKAVKIFPYTSIESQKADCCSSKVRIRKLITKHIGANNFVMRLFEIEPEGNTPLHTHPWEHEVFILEGEGAVLTEKNYCHSRLTTWFSFVQMKGINSRIRARHF